MLFGRKAEKGLSLRTIHIWLIVVAMAMSGVMLYSTYRLTANFRRVMRASEEHMAMGKGGAGADVRLQKAGQEYLYVLCEVGFLQFYIVMK